MTAVAGAPSTRFTHWKAIDWKTAENQVSRLRPHDPIEFL